MAVKIDGVLVDIPKAERGFTRYDSVTRADRAASFRLGFRQRESIGEAWWTHAYCPGVCFPTKTAAYRAALRTLEESETPAEIVARVRKEFVVTDEASAQAARDWERVAEFVESLPKRDPNEPRPPPARDDCGPLFSIHSIRAELGRNPRKSAWVALRGHVFVTLNVTRTARSIRAAATHPCWMQVSARIDARDQLTH